MKKNLYKQKLKLKNIYKLENKKKNSKKEPVIKTNIKLFID